RPWSCTRATATSRPWPRASWPSGSGSWRRPRATRTGRTRPGWRAGSTRASRSGGASMNDGARLCS
ncbi:unnamed protein product, partial [Heterosigma akashiwo]